MKGTPKQERFIKRIEAMRYHCEVREAPDCPYWIEGSGVYNAPDIVTEGEHAGRYVCPPCKTFLRDSSTVERRAHYPCVAGSTPAPATNSSEVNEPN